MVDPAADTLPPPRRDPFDVTHFGFDRHCIAGSGRSEESGLDPGDDDVEAKVRQRRHAETDFFEQLDAGDLEVLDVGRVVEMVVLRIQLVEANLDVMGVEHGRQVYENPCCRQAS